MLLSGMRDVDFHILIRRATARPDVHHQLATLDLDGCMLCNTNRATIARM